MDADNLLLGLNAYELRAYEALLRGGKSTATKISQTSEVPQGKIYLVLDSLIKKGLIDSIPKEPKEFIPNNPRLLVRFLNKRSDEIGILKNKVEQLEQLYNNEVIPDESKVLVRQGKRAFYNLVRNLKDSEKYEYSLRWNYEFHKDWAKKDRSQIKKGVDIKILTRNDKETQKNVKKWLSVHKNIKQIDNGGVAISIQDDKDVMITVIGCNSTIFVRDRAFAKLMKKMFLSTYDAAKRVS